MHDGIDLTDYRVFKGREKVSPAVTESPRTQEPWATIAVSVALGAGSTAVENAGAAGAAFFDLAFLTGPGCWATSSSRALFEACAMAGADEDAGDGLLPRFRLGK